jgi:ankyrin repeat protein
MEVLLPPDVSALPPGSILITYAPASNQIQVTESNRLIMKHNNEIGGNGILIDCLNELPHYITQTATVSIHKHDGKIFQHTLRNGHHCSQLTNLNKLLSVELNTFLEHFAQEFPDLDIRDKLTVLEGFSDEDLLKFRNESFIHKTAINDYSLLKALQAGVIDFSDQINYVSGGETALIIASELGYIEVANAILAKDNVDVNIENYNGETVLVIALQRDYIDIAETILAKDNVNVNIPDKNGNTSLIIASGKGYTDIAKTILVKDGVNVNIQNGFATTALIAAAEKGYTEIVKAILAKDNVDVNIQNYFDDTALMIALRYGYKDIAKAISAKANSDVNIQDNEELVVASEDGYTEINNNKEEALFSSDSRLDDSNLAGEPGVENPIY